jgi:hypothetical protein
VQYFGAGESFFDLHVLRNKLRVVCVGVMMDVGCGGGSGLMSGHVCVCVCVCVLKNKCAGVMPHSWR